MISPAEWWCNDSEIEMVENTHCLKYYNYVWEIANAPCNGMDAKDYSSVIQEAERKRLPDTRTTAFRDYVRRYGAVL